MSSEKSDSRRPNIFHYVDYRSFLKDLFQHLKSSDHKYFSHRYFAKRAGFRSSAFLKLVLDGKRKISPDSIDRFADAFGLVGPEKSFFRKMVMLNQAKNVEEKRFYAEQMLRSQTFRQAHPLSREQFEYLDNWYYVVVREMVGLKGFREDPEWISEQLSPKVTPSEVKRALLELEKLGFIERDSRGQLRLQDPVLSYNEAIWSAAASQYHRNMIRLGAESMERFEREIREIAGVTLGFSKVRVQEVKLLIQKFRKELIQMSIGDSDQERIYQVNFQFFPLTGPVKPNKE